MTDFFTRQARKVVTGALAPVEAAGTRLLGTAGIGAVAIACLLAAIIFLSIALDLWLAQIAGPVIAALGAAGFYLIVAVLCLLLLRARRMNAQVKAPPAPAETAEKSEISASIEETLAPFVAILHDLGLKREETAVRLGTEVAKQLGPLALFAVALAAGFLFERSLNNSKKPQ